ncbi:antibiotic biosynthesis monooxygenase [Chitinimonas arctica]|uniref:Antibiotic biosynthesis monooxygenase n=1 Tax=Chitinimonas arctica TaxID=2594795 RepID=A0A516SH28_9NEIS|nr:putative quinol monooxygenase [Chitinimonas arctica]QDQ27467.1 antibiotic biosynthesis monooxygenase [Chitinimonas arctica]
MQALIVVATIVAKAGAEQQVEHALQKLIAPTRMEAGCIQYVLHRDLDQPGVFVFIETWQSRELHAQHMQSAHLAEYGRSVSGLVESWDVKLLNSLA